MFNKIVYSMKTVEINKKDIQNVDTGNDTSPIALLQQYFNINYFFPFSNVTRTFCPLKDKANLKCVDS